MQKKQQKKQEGDKNLFTELYVWLHKVIQICEQGILITFSI